MLRDHGALLESLLQSPLDYRHALGILDPEYQEWRPEGKPAHEVIFFGEAALLLVKTDRVHPHLLWEPDTPAAQALVRYLADWEFSVLEVLGEPGFRALKPLLCDGKWTVSRNYGVTASRFRPRPSNRVRSIGPEDPVASSPFACEMAKTMPWKPWQRDFDLMTRGLPVTCYGAFAGDELVGFCSSNPICRGVTEISVLAVASQHRRQGLASGMLTAQAQEAFECGNSIGYYSGGAGYDVDAMLTRLGFWELKPSYRFVPASSPEQWQAWGKPV
jgi:ribosomal protein S18 acetylase RimI-like enzyme